MTDVLVAAADLASNFMKRTDGRHRHAGFEARRDISPALSTCMRYSPSCNLGAGRHGGAQAEIADAFAKAGLTASKPRSSTNSP